MRRYPGPGDATVTWDVIDADGTWRATLELPTSFSPQHVDGNTVLGVWRDALDVEHVVRYGLDRSAGDPSH